MATHTDIVVVGAGVVGLTSALCLSRVGYKVVVVARQLPGDVTTEWASPWAGAGIMPQQTDDLRDIRMQKASFRQWGALAQKGPETGVKEVTATEYWDDRDQPSSPWYASFLPDFRTLDPHELPPGTRCGNTFKALTVDPEITLNWLRHHLETTRNVRFIRQDVSNLPDLQHQHNSKYLINATGLGAKDLASDPAVLAIRGQTLLIDASNSPRAAALAREIIFRRGTEYTYVIPRMLAPDSAILGGIEQPGDFSGEVDPVLRKDIVGRVGAMTGGGFGGLDLERDVIRDVVGFRPGRTGGCRVERQGDVVHAYGFGGAGYRYSFGAAEEVVRLVQGDGRAKL